MVFERSKVDAFLEDLTKHDQEPVLHEAFREPTEEEDIHDEKTPRNPEDILQVGESFQTQRPSINDEKHEDASAKTEPSTATEMAPNVLKLESESPPPEDAVAHELHENDDS